uniref:Glycosyltransferase N-terminal domain-containing protein n=1 Tax=Fagus sylvatica TaxID=28930 RepID=A0A2N9HIM4_FAGSY
MQPHVVVIPYPAQGHVAPLMKLSHLIVGHGIKVTFVTTEFIHAKLTASMPVNNEEKSPIRLVSIPDGLEPGDDRNDLTKLLESVVKFMPAHFKDLIEKINKSDDDDQISCVIADTAVGWALEVAEKMGIKRAAFFPAGPGNLALQLHIPKLIEDGIIDAKGTPVENNSIWLSKGIPAWSITLSHVGSFWSEDLTCLSWLDKQPVGSVIYVAFGSTSIHNQQQFEELAFGLELIGQPFLWVVRSDIINGPLSEFLDGFKTRIIDRGYIVEWACQEKVLAHPSTACFLSHCGWNSTLEGISMGVPFLCWPYFADQFHNKSYICDAWKVGLGLNPDENGLITRHEINTKIKTLLFDDGIKTNALKLKEMAKKSVTEGGSSFKNFKSFIEQIKH